MSQPKRRKRMIPTSPTYSPGSPAYRPLHPYGEEEEDIRARREPANWLDLPMDVTLSILSKLPLPDIMMSAQLVCKTWLNVCKDPSMWKSIDLSCSDLSFDEMEGICGRAVDRSRGGLVNIDLHYYGSHRMLMWIAHRASELKVIKCNGSSANDFIKAVVKLPLLEDLELTDVDLSRKTLSVVGSSCTHLKSFTCKFIWQMRYRSLVNSGSADSLATAIAKTMPELRHLHLYRNPLTVKGLQAILDGCPHLESLQLTYCKNINLAKRDGRLAKLHTDRIKDFKLTDGEPFMGLKYYYSDSDGDDL